MNHVPAVSLVLLFGSMTVAAQSLVLNRQPAVLNGVPMSSGCPIGMRVEHGNSEQSLQANGERPTGIAQQLHVVMSNLGSADIVGAQITAHGFAAKTRSLPAQYPHTGSPKLTKTVALKLTMKSEGNAYSDVRLPSFTTVSLIDLDSVTYADGSTWHSSASQTCHAVPELMMLVSSR
jgi:hypothetical protein